MPTDVRIDVPFLGGGPAISEQILQGMHMGVQERQSQQRLKMEQDVDTAQIARDNAATNLANLQAQYEQEDRPDRKALLSNQLSKAQNDVAESTMRLKASRKQMQDMGIDPDAQYKPPQIPDFPKYMPGPNTPPELFQKFSSVHPNHQDRLASMYPEFFAKTPQMPTLENAPQQLFQAAAHVPPQTAQVFSMLHPDDQALLAKTRPADFVPAPEPEAPKTAFDRRIDTLRDSLGKMTADETAQFESGVLEAKQQSTQNLATGGGITYQPAVAALQAISRQRQETSRQNPTLSPSQISQFNSGMQARYQVLNPGQNLPQAFTLGTGATKSDFERIDKLMESTERAAGVKSQQDLNRTMRQQSQDLTLTIGEDKNGRLVALPADEARAAGLKNIYKAGAQESEKITNARNLVPLFNSTDPNDIGIIALATKLDKEGKLGPLAGRWNEFLSGKYGSGDPEYAELRTLMGLSTTALMQVHVGSRGGAFMLEHFQDLADAGKMDGPTLLTGLKTEARYIERKAMLPHAGAVRPSGAASAQDEAAAFMQKHSGKP